MRVAVFLAVGVVLGAVAVVDGALDRRRRLRLEHVIEVRRAEARAPAEREAAPVRAVAPEPRPIARAPGAVAVPAHGGVPHETYFDRALSTGDGGSAVFVDVQGLLRTPLGAVIRACARADGGRSYAELVEIFGGDPMDLAERAAGTERLLVLQGRFHHAQAPEGARWEPYGERGALLAGGRNSLARWAREGAAYLLVGPEPDLREAIDRLEGRASYTVGAAGGGRGLIHGELGGRAGHAFGLHDLITLHGGGLPITFSADASADLTVDVEVPLAAEGIDAAIAALGTTSSNVAFEDVEPIEGGLRFRLRVPLALLEAGRAQCEAR